MPLTSAQKQHRRRKALDEIAASRGFDSHYKLMTAIMNGEAMVITMNVVDSWDIDETTSFEIVETEVGNVARITYHTSGIKFTTMDWQGTQPESPDEIADFDWVSTDGRPAIMFKGLPVLLE